MPFYFAVKKLVLARLRDLKSLLKFNLFQAEFSTAGGEATFARFFRLDEAMDEFSSRRNSVNSAVFHNGGVEAAAKEGARIREAMETHAVLLFRVRGLPLSTSALRGMGGKVPWMGVPMVDLVMLGCVNFWTCDGGV